jgi:chromatin remodeling complex protein RSC6
MSQMLSTPSACFLFQELFSTEWVEDDEKFREELERYRGVIQRLMSMDLQLTNYIKSQPIMDFDQLSSIPVVSATEKTTIIASVTSSHISGFGYDVKLVSTDSSISSLFSKVVISFGQHVQEFSDFNSSDMNIETSFSQSDFMPITIKCEWKIPVVRLSPALAKFMGSSYAVPGLVALKLMQHIDNKHLSENGEIKCDQLLKTIFEVDSIKMDSLSNFINKNTTPLAPIVFELSEPSSKKAMNIQYPIMSTDNNGQFKANTVEPAPIVGLLEECVKSKEMIEAIDAFMEDPYNFTENQVSIYSRSTEVPEIYTSSYLFDQPWITNAADHFLKTSYYKRTRNSK